MGGRTHGARARYAHAAPADRVAPGPLCPGRRRADAAGASPSARQALGFAELLAGDVPAMKQRTRRYAKRQLTWLRKLPGTLDIDLTDRSAQDGAGEVRSALRVAAESSSEPMKRENGPMNAQ